MDERASPAVEALLQQGRQLVQASQVYPAIDVFETALSQHPSCVEAQIELGTLYLRVGAIPKGRRYLQQALANQPTAAQRWVIEGIVREQNRLDPKRYYRPDFEALHQQSRGLSLREMWRGAQQWWRRTRKN